MIEEMVKELAHTLRYAATEDMDENATKNQLKNALTRLHDATVEACEKAVNNLEAQATYPLSDKSSVERAVALQEVYDSYWKEPILQALRSMRINQLTER